MIDRNVLILKIFGSKDLWLIQQSYETIACIDSFESLSGLTKMDLGESQFQPLPLSDSLSFEGLGTPLQAPLASPQE